MSCHGPELCTNPDYASTVAEKVDDILGLVSLVCEEERCLALKCRSVSLYVSLRPVFLPADQGSPIVLACRELLRNCFTHAYPSDECALVGVHLWSAQSPDGPTTHLLVADAGHGFDGSIVAGRGLARAQAAMETAGGALQREPGAGTIWWVALPFAHCRPEISAGIDLLNGAPACR